VEAIILVVFILHDMLGTQYANDAQTLVSAHDKLV
jgi:hypothetical protein